MPTVSFLMSNYKTPPAYLRRALDSMLTQTFTDFEIVAVNDGVRDESYEVLVEYAEKHDTVRLIENENNLGLPASLNRGIARCTGKYIARMDTDDICSPDRLALQVAYMENHPEVMFAGAWADLFDDDETKITGQWQPTMCPREEHRIRLLFSGEPLLIHPTVIFRASFLQAFGLRYSEDAQYRYSEDYEFWTRCADCGPAGILEQPVLKYRLTASENRITVRHAQEMRECVQNVQKKLFARLLIAPTQEEYALNARLLAGRKPYDIRYKEWMDRLLSQNKKLGIYDQATMKRLFHERWYSIVYYAIAYEQSTQKKFRCFFSLYADQYVRFVKDVLRKRLK